MVSEESDVQRVKAAQLGDKHALAELISSIQPKIFALAVRFLWHPDDAEDVTQEIMIKVITHLGNFRHESKFSTWVYSIASNTLISQKKRRMELMELSFDGFAQDLMDGLDTTGYEHYVNHFTGSPAHDDHPATDARLLEEVKVGCTLALLLCLDRKHRLAYIFGEIMEFDHQDASDMLNISPSAYRKQLSRARQQVIEFTQLHCGLINPQNLCHCSKRVTKAIELKRVNKQQLIFSSADKPKEHFVNVCKEIEALEETRRIAAIYQSSALPNAKTELSLWLKEQLNFTAN